MARTKSVSRYRNDSIVQNGTEIYYGPRTLINTDPRTDDQYYLVLYGDTYQRVAFKTLGDARYWWVIADFNDALDPFTPPEVGTHLRVPSRPRLWTDILT